MFLPCFHQPPGGHFQSFKKKKQPVATPWGGVGQSGTETTFCAENCGPRVCWWFLRTGGPGPKKRSVSLCLTPRLSSGSLGEGGGPVTKCMRSDWMHWMVTRLADGPPDHGGQLPRRHDAAQEQPEVREEQHVQPEDAARVGGRPGGGGPGQGKCTLCLPKIRNDNIFARLWSKIFRFRK